MLNILTFLVLIAFLFGYFVEYMTLCLKDDGRNLASNPSMVTVIRIWTALQVGGLMHYLKRYLKVVDFETKDETAVNV